VTFENEKTALRIVSGGQTGADRSALDWAISQGVPHGGWCPRGRKAEDAVIPNCYQLQETETDDYAERTERNVMDSDGTVIFTVDRALVAGSKLTWELAAIRRKPVLHLHADSPQPGLQLAAFIRKHRIQVLNVAGSRASEEAAVGSFVAQTLDGAFEELTSGTR